MSMRELQFEVEVPMERDYVTVLSYNSTKASLGIKQFEEVGKCSYRWTLEYLEYEEIEDLIEALQHVQRHMEGMS